MKYLIQHETRIFILIVCCIVSSTVIIEFVPGFYHHIKQERWNESYGQYSFSVDFLDESKSVIKKGDVVARLLNLGDEVWKNCHIEMGCKYAADCGDTASKESAGLVQCVDFCIQNGNVAVDPSVYEDWKENGFYVDGSYFTEQQLDEEDLVCIAFPENIMYQGDEKILADRYKPSEQGTYIIDGKEYACIGHSIAATYIPFVPITTVSDDTYVEWIYFSFDDVITEDVYSEISNALTNAYGALADVSEFEMQNKKMGNNIFLQNVLCFALIGVASLALAFIFEFILGERKKQLGIFRICGLSRMKACILFVLECYSMFAFVYIVTTWCFEICLLPVLQKSFSYIKEAYSVYTYMLLFAFYSLTILTGLWIITAHRIKRNVI